VAEPPHFIDVVGGFLWIRSHLRGTSQAINVPLASKATSRPMWWWRAEICLPPIGFREILYLAT
jgi:hypothetical protein